MKEHILEVWDDYDNHYKIYETDDITIDGTMLAEHDLKVETEIIGEVKDIMRNAYTNNEYCPEECEKRSGYSCAFCLYAYIRNQLEQLQEKKNE